MELGVTSEDLLRTILFYVIFGMFIFLQPIAIRQAGLTIPQLCQGLLGNPTLDFLKYQLRRISITMITHILFVPGFFLTLSIVSRRNLFVTEPASSLEFLAVFSFAFTCVGLTYVAYITVGDFREHYVTKKLRKNYRDISAFSVEISRGMMDPFSIKIVDSVESGVYVFDSYVIRVSYYNIELVRLSDAIFTVVRVHDHPFRTQNDDCQIILVDVTSDTGLFKPFTIHIQSRTIMQLIRDKVGSRFRTPPNVNIAFSMKDRFVQDFRRVIAENEVFDIISTVGLDTCFGCMAIPPNVKIVKSCGSANCATCQCRPTWCHSCLGRIFAHEQDQEDPQNWMAGHARCPTCRSNFCVLDVRPIRIVHENGEEFQPPAE